MQFCEYNNISSKYLISNDQQPTCTNAACRNQTLTIKKLPQGVLQMQWRENKIKLQYPGSYKNTTDKGCSISGDRDTVFE